MLENRKISRGVYRKLLLRFGLTVLIYIGVIFLLALGGYIVLRMKVWYPEDSWYPFLHWAHKNVENLVIFCVIAGVVFIICYYFYLIAKLFEKMIKAVDQVYQGDSDELVALPEILREVEKQLNQLMISAKENRLRMEQLQKQKNDLIMYMAHDLKTPLTSVIGYLSLLHDEKEIQAETRERYLKIALQKSYRLEELINEFFEITRIGYSDIILSKSRVNFTRMTEQMLYEFKPVFEQKNLNYTLEYARDIYAEIDVEQMERVFDNLLKNIVNYSFEGSGVNVSLGVENGMMTCILVNHGETIPKEKLEHIFEQFYRMDSARESRTGGTGLGLAIVKRILELHGGGISCESENERILFRIFLPVSEEVPPRQ